MKKLGFLLIILFLASCNQEYTVIEERYPDGSPKRECTYIGKGDSKQILKETVYYQNKRIQMTGGYKNNLRDGHWLYYYETGRIWSDGFFKEGKNDGKRTTYFESGKVRYEGFYKDDARTGTWKFYDEAGNLVKAVDYSKEK
jgi:antitoxin component YwqK of YwqJK toxin-antitoxin module